MSVGKVGRNDSCICGSGKKYKHCCGKLGTGSEQPSTVSNALVASTFNAARQMHLDGQLLEANDLYQKVLQLAPGHIEALHMVGCIASQSGLFDIAVELIGQALKSMPRSAQAHNNLGGAYQGQGNAEEAVASFRRALHLKPDYPEAHNNLGMVLREQGKWEMALAAFRAAIAFKPDYAKAHANLALVLMNCRQYGEAVSSFRRALRLQPHDNLIHSNLLLCLQYAPGLAAHEVFGEAQAFASRFEAPLRSGWRKHDNTPEPGRILKVGYVSADFLGHSIANFVEPVLANHDRSQLRLYGYYNRALRDQHTERIAARMDNWLECHAMSDDQLAERIRADGIDILIDLSGHTSLNRLLTFARKPAPVQASWLGYPGTTGLHAVDYFLADRFLLPTNNFDDQFTERIGRLPTQIAFQPFQEAPDINESPASRNGFITFGSFNSTDKIGRAVVALWAQLLHAIPDSRFVLGAMPDDGNSAGIEEWFRQDGIDRSRLHFHGKCSLPDYLRLHHQVDIHLDTFPYNGGTTTWHAIWMGVPTLTLAGATAAGRTGACILGHVGLQDFVANNKEDFVAKGVGSAKDIQRLVDLRQTMRQRFLRSAPGDPARFTASLEAAMRIMWQRWCEGLPAQSFEVPPQDANTLETEFAP